LVNLCPLLSLKVHCYPECTEELRPRYKSTAAERWMQSHLGRTNLFTLCNMHWENNTLTLCFHNGLLLL